MRDYLIFVGVLFLLCGGGFTLFGQSVSCDDHRWEIEKCKEACAFNHGMAKYSPTEGCICQGSMMVQDGGATR